MTAGDILEKIEKLNARYKRVNFRLGLYKGSKSLFEVPSEKVKKLEEDMEGITAEVNKLLEMNSIKDIIIELGKLHGRYADISVRRNLFKALPDTFKGMTEEMCNIEKDIDKLYKKEIEVGGIINEQSRNGAKR